METPNWNEQGDRSENLGNHEEAIRCYDKALELDPGEAFLWTARAFAAHKAGNAGEEMHSYRKFLACASPQEDRAKIRDAHKRLRELGGE